INRQRHIDFAAPYEIPWKAHIDLIETDEVCLRPGIDDLGLYTADPGAYRREIAPEPYSCAEQDQKDLVGFRTEIDRTGNAAGIPALGHRLVPQRSVSPDPQRHGRRHAAAGGIGCEQPWGHPGDLRLPGRDRTIPTNDGYRG